MSDNTAAAIVILAIVIGVLGFPFAINEYNKWQEREQLNRIMHDASSKAVVVKKTPTFTVYNPTVPPQPQIQRQYVAPAPTIQRTITDGFWCRATTINIGKAPTDVKECYQFFSDGTFKWGYLPGWPMGKSPSCSGEMNAKCMYSLNSAGKYEVQGGYIFTKSGDYLIDAHNPPYYRWTASGIP